MAIFIKDGEMKDEYLRKFRSIQEKHLERILSAWQERGIKHDFKNEGLFKKAVRRNLKALDFPDMLKLFRQRNFLFSTQESGTLETLYFRSARSQTGRLRQQHPKGPLARIDNKTKTHLFLSPKRFECLKEWHKRHKHKAPPGIKDAERRPKNGMRHIEFAFEGEKEVSGWHKSRGKVKRAGEDPGQLVASALKAILGI